MNIPHDIGTFVIAVTTAASGAMIGFAGKQGAEFYSEGKQAHLITKLHADLLQQMANDLDIIRDMTNDVRVSVASNRATLDAIADRRPFVVELKDGEVESNLESIIDRYINARAQ